MSSLSAEEYLRKQTMASIPKKYRRLFPTMEKYVTEKDALVAVQKAREESKDLQEAIRTHKIHCPCNAELEEQRDKAEKHLNAVIAFSDKAIVKAREEERIKVYDEQGIVHGEAAEKLIESIKNPKPLSKADKEFLKSSVEIYNKFKPNDPVTEARVRRETAKEINDWLVDNVNMNTDEAGKWEDYKKRFLAEGKK